MRFPHTCLGIGEKGALCRCLLCCEAVRLDDIRPIQRPRPRFHRNWSPEEDRLVKRAMESGHVGSLSIRGRTPKAIWTRAWTLRHREAR